MFNNKCPKDNRFFSDYIKKGSGIVEVLTIGGRVLIYDKILVDVYLLNITIL